MREKGEQSPFLHFYPSHDINQFFD